MESKINQLMEMGATRAQAKAALSRYKDADQAAEKFFEGEFENVKDEDEGGTASGSHTRQEPKESAMDVDDDEASDPEDDEDDDVEDYAYDSDDGDKPPLTVGNIDPYAGIFFSKDRREEVIEIEEDPETFLDNKLNCHLTLISQGEFMKGCSEGGEQGFLFSLYMQLSRGECSCPGCGDVVGRNKRDFFTLYPNFASYIKHLEELVPQTCRRCRKEFCLACGESNHPDKPPTSSKVTAQGPSRPRALFHCPDLQGVILGVGLIMLERLFEEQSGSHPTQSADDSPSAKKRKVKHPSSVSYFPDFAGKSGKSAPGGTGYAGDQREDLTGQLEAMSQQRSKDVSMSGLFCEIRDYLPSLRRENGSFPSDYLVHPTALAHLRRRFNRICSSLLRNDSLSDMSDRSVLYYELFEWLSTISNHEALASMMGMPIMVVCAREPRGNKKGGQQEIAVIYEGSAGPRELLESIAIQAQAAIKGLEGTSMSKALENTLDMTEEDKRKTHDAKGKEKEVPVQPDENLKLLTFCRRILETRGAIDRSLTQTKGDAFIKRLHATLPKIPSAGGHDSSADIIRVANKSEAETRQLYEEWAGRVRFEYCDLSVPNEDAENNSGESVEKWKFFYSSEARLLAGSDLPRRSLAIAKELAVLTMNLPVAWNSSIFLRVDEARVDIIKALIIGPEGTPYQNGCYLFDIFLGSSYNQAPPSVKYMTTNGGKFRFNPNLYADGKVCLSLLGTWQGPGWVPGKSTLLQVLISIQSMILCEEPYLNEPGWANGAGSSASAGYSANVRRMVVHTAMLGNLRSPPEPFEDIIRTHFRLKAQEIRQQLDKWLEIDDKKTISADDQFVGITSKKTVDAATMKSCVAEMKEMLRC